MPNHSMKLNSMPVSFLRIHLSPRKISLERVRVPKRLDGRHEFCLKGCGGQALGFNSLHKKQECLVHFFFIQTILEFLNISSF